MSRKGKGDAEAPDGDKKARKGKGSAEAAGDELAIRVGAHPRARRSIRRTRAQAGIAGFAIVLLLAMNAGVPTFEALLRALAGGLLLHFGTWACAIALWRRLIVVELEAARASYLERTASAAAPTTGVSSA